MSNALQGALMDSDAINSHSFKNINFGSNIVPLKSKTMIPPHHG